MPIRNMSNTNHRHQPDEIRAVLSLLCIHPCTNSNANLFFTTASPSFPAALPMAVASISLFSSDSNIDNPTRTATMTPMRGSTLPDLAILAGLYLQDEKSFVVRRCLQLFLAGEISSQEAIARIRDRARVRDEEPDHPPDS